MHMSNRIFSDKKKIIPHRENCQNQLSHLSLSHIAQEYHKSLIQGKIQIQQLLTETSLSFTNICKAKTKVT